MIRLAVFFFALILCLNAVVFFASLSFTRPLYEIIDAVKGIRSGNI